jgi:hypothetical protein
LVLLAQNCLQKEPASRLKLVTWEALIDGVRSEDWDTSAVRERIRQRKAAREGVAGTPVTVAQGLNVCRDITQRVQELARREATDASVLPPSYVSSSIASPTRCQVKIDVPPSPADALDVQLTFFIDIDVVDTGTIAVSVMASACIAGTPPSVAETVALFKGTLNDDVLGTSLSRLFAVGLDLAQARSVGVDQDTGSEWLALANTWEAANG